jgi:hypothetical protein
MISSKRISLALAALVLVVLAGAGSAFAQTVSWNLSTAPTFVANTGRSEVMGQVTMTGDVICGTNADAFCVSTAGTIQVLYVGTAIDNALATANIGLINTNGIEVCENISGVIGCNGITTAYLSGGAGGFTIVNTTAGGVVSYGVKGAINIAAGDQVVVRGVRGRIDQGPGNVVGTSVIGQLTASPSTIAGFSPTAEVVARSADPLTMAFEAWTILQCREGGAGTVTVTEGFNTAFVDHDVETGDTATANDRPLFGGTNNSHIRIELTGLPSGLTITWPDSDVDSGGGATGAFLRLIDQSASGDEAEYRFETPFQDLSDVNGEEFEILLSQTAYADPSVELSGTLDDFGSTTGQGQMWPGTSPTANKPRYNHPLEPVPGDPFLTVAPCTTNLLYPWVLNFAGLDTGIAISNTSADPYGTIPQTGSCTVNFWPTSQTTNNGVSAGGAVSITTANIQPGSVWRTSLSGTPAFAGLAGYVIAVCRFQYGHGFAFITDNFGVGPAATAQGYLAQVIPDPVILDGRSAALNGVDILLPGTFPPSGETLGQ